MPQKLTLSQIAERLLYLLAVLFTPNIPLFFLYSQNVEQGLLFSHFLIFGGVMAVMSLVLYLLISKFALRRRRTVVLLTLFWATFWFFNFFKTIITRGNAEFSQKKVVVYLLVLIVIIGFLLRYVSMNRFVANTIAMLLCCLFAFNFIPEALTVAASARQRTENKKSETYFYEIKTAFTVDPNLPHPNVYWLHMDGLMGFDAVERYFNDPQTELQNQLEKRGFVINKSARLEAGETGFAVAAMTSPCFYDSYLADEFARVAQLTRSPRQKAMAAAMAEKGFSLEDIYLKIELLKALSDAGYTNIGGYSSSYGSSILKSENIDIKIDEKNTFCDLGAKRGERVMFEKIVDFKNLVVDASALSIMKEKIDQRIERARPVENTQPIPEYRETIDRYITGSSDSDGNMLNVVSAMKYTASLDQTPHFIYYVNDKAHCVNVKTMIGGVDYEQSIGRTFIYDENGNVYKERLKDPNDVKLYYPQHKYALKEMMAQVDTIIENDPGAVIILQADHGINGIGPGYYYFDLEFMYERGYSLEDQLNLNLSVLSAVRIPPQYGRLTQPLDPLDIARYLINHFVGQGNYDYLYYREEDSFK